MEKTGVLNCNNNSAGDSRASRLWAAARAACCALALLPSAWGTGAMPGLDELPPAEKYRQLNLVLMVSEGIEPAFLNHLLAQPAGDSLDLPTTDEFPLIDVDAFQTQLNRIVDQAALIRNAARVFQFEQDNRAAIVQAMDEVVAAYPAAAASIDLIALAEDAIIVRTALSGSLEYLAGSGDAPLAGYVKTYQNRTLYLRNVMEFWEFNQELAALTDEAMDETGGRMAAYQRMLEDEPAMDSFEQHLQAVEHIYWQSRGGKGKPPKIPGDELIEAESEVQ